MGDTGPGMWLMSLRDLVSPAVSPAHFVQCSVPVSVPSLSTKNGMIFGLGTPGLVPAWCGLGQTLWHRVLQWVTLTQGQFGDRDRALRASVSQGMQEEDVTGLGRSRDSGAVLWDKGGTRRVGTQPEVGTLTWDPMPEPWAGDFWDFP